MESLLRVLLERASVRNGGGILLGKTVVADGFWARRKIRVVTHAHSDHTIDLNKSVSVQGFIASTPMTFEMLKFLGFKIPKSKRLELNAGECIKLNDEKLCFVKAEHIPGSVQVLLENEKGARILYTGDFKNPGSGTPIVEDLDVLIMDATYGDPRFQRPSEIEIEEAMINIIDNSLRKGMPVRIYAYHGKIQEVMHLLRIYGIRVPFVAPPKICAMSKALERYGYKMGELYCSHTDEGREVSASEHIFFTHFNKFEKEKGRFTKMKLDGWLVGRTYQRLGENSWRVAFSDHADYRGTLMYALESKAKIVIVDGFRSSYASAFASKLRLKGIHAFVMPRGL